jgi:L-fucose isomerase-like protein
MDERRIHSTGRQGPKGFGSKRRVRVGLVSTFNEVFVGDEEGLLRRSVAELETLSQELGFDFHPFREGLVDAEDAEKARRQMEDMNVDFLLVQTTSFPDGDVILPLAHSEALLGLWALPETSEEGPLPLNSFCGTNMFSSTLGYYLKQHEILFKWFYGLTDHDLFRPRFEITMAALRAIINLREARILQIGGRAPGFHDLYFDERAFEKRFGCQIDVLHSTDEVLERAREQPPSAVEEVQRKIELASASCRVSGAALERSARLYLALLETAQENRCQAMAVSCWPKFQDEYSVVPCAAYGFLNEAGVICACEGDVPGAISMLLLNYLHGGPAALMDVSDLHERNQEILFFHCGVAPVSYADREGVILTPHSILGRRGADGSLVRDLGTVADMVFRPGPATAMRVLGEADSVFVVSGNIVGGKGRGFDGSRGWMGDLAISGESASVREFVNTLLVGRIPHHLAIAYGDLSDPLFELAAWLRLATVHKVPYQAYLQS